MASFPSYAPSYAYSYASSVSPKQRLPMASFIAAMWRLLSGFTDEDRPLLVKGLAFLRANDARATKHKVLIESLECLEDVIRTKNACHHCVPEPLYACIGCGLHLCPHTEVEIEEAGTGTLEPRDFSRVPKKTMLLVTGASDNHARSLRNFIASFVRHNVAGKHRLLVWNLGLTDWASIQSPLPHVSYEVFDFTKYPDWMDIAKDAGQYAWKPAILKLVAARHPAELIVWMDAGNLVIDPLRNLERFLRSNALYSSYSVGRIQDWTHPACVAALSPWGSLNAGKLNRNGACIGFNLTAERARQCLEEWAAACENKEIIAPVGSSRANHRQDQSVFSILYYKYVGSDAISNVFLGYTIHNDSD